jgi:hypothetical protein
MTVFSESAEAFSGNRQEKAIITERVSAVNIFVFFI